jgi:hypothetical protein
MPAAGIGNSCSSSGARPEKVCDAIPFTTADDRRAEGPAPGAATGPKDYKLHVRAARSTDGGAGGAVYVRHTHAAAARPVLTPLPHATGFAIAPAGEGDTRSTFHAQASATFARVGASIDAGPDPGAGDDNELRNLLAGIAADVQHMMSGAYEAAAAECAGAIEFARRTLPRDQAAGVIGALKAARDAAFAAIRQRAADELAGRREAAVRAHRRPFRPFNPRAGLTAEPRI